MVDPSRDAGVNRIEFQAERAEAREALRSLLVIQERVVADRLADLQHAAEGPDSIGRALHGIVVDTLGEKEALENVLREWDSLERGKRLRVRVGPPYRDLAESLLGVKRSAARAYRRAAEAAPSSDLAESLDRLATQSGEHAAILLTLIGEAE